MNGLPRWIAGMVVGGAIAATPVAAAAQAGELSDARIELHERTLGDFTWPVTTRSERAQAYFDQGVRLMFAYATQQAGLSFAEAARVDSTCAMCWWGEAWAAGPTFNSGMDTSALRGVRDAISRARRFGAAGTPLEQALIAAMDIRHGQGPFGASGSRASLNEAYAQAMAEVYARFPDDPQVATLYADALMLLEPRRGTWPIDKPSVQLIHRVLEGVLDEDPGHPGACHAYVHATETTPRVVQAQRCADVLGASIPGASHINHMPSHTYNRVGRWGDATRANIEAWETDQRAERGEGFAIYPSHNLHMLLFSATMDGQIELALTAAREYGRYDPAGSVGFQSLILARAGRFDEVLALRDEPQQLLHVAYWHFGRGLAHVRQGRADSAAYLLARLDSAVAAAPAGRTFRVHEWTDLMGIVRGLLAGEIHRSAGRIDATSRVPC